MNTPCRPAGLFYLKNKGILARLIPVEYEAEKLRRGPSMDSQEAKVFLCEKIRVAIITILILTVGELILGKILNRIMVAPDLGLVLILAGLTLAGVVCLRIREIKKGK
jgi:hypothetical protein